MIKHRRKCEQDIYVLARAEGRHDLLPREGRQEQEATSHGTVHLPGWEEAGTSKGVLRGTVVRVWCPRHCSLASVPPLLGSQSSKPAVRTGSKHSAVAVRFHMRVSSLLRGSGGQKEECHLGSHLRAMLCGQLGVGGNGGALRAHPQASQTEKAMP